MEISETSSLELFLCLEKKICFIKQVHLHICVLPVLWYKESSIFQKTKLEIPLLGKIRVKIPHFRAFDSFASRTVSVVH